MEIGGILAGAALIVFGIAALYVGIDARNTVRDSIKQENITFGSTEDPAVAKHAEEWAGQDVRTGDQARAFALIIREHALGGSGGLTYSEMGRYLAADDPEDSAGTSDPEAALTDEAGNPVPNAARNTWVTATALTTALNMSYLSERLSLFGIVVGISLILAGFGFIVLALAVLGGAFEASEEKRAAQAAQAATSTG